MRLASTVLALSAGALVSLGLVVMASSEIEFGLGSSSGRQMLWCALGLMAAWVAGWLDYRWLKRVTWPLYVVALGLLVAVLISGERRNGAIRWMELPGGMSFQPSEVAKLALILALAWYGERYQRFMSTFGRGLVTPTAIAGAMLVLVFLEPDWGTTVLLAGVAGGMLLIAGVRWLHVLPIAAVGVAVLAALLLNNPVRLSRVESWWRPEATKEGVGYQAYQAKLALASGGLTGAGLGHGEHYGYVPEHRTDFIFALVGEELGLAGTGGVVLAYALFAIAGVSIAWRARDMFGMLLASGLTLLVSLQALINMGVVTSVLPNKGLPLPLVSKGGSSLFITLVLVGLLFSVARTTARPRPRDEPVCDLEESPATLS